jgi:hypothetical protein
MNSIHSSSSATRNEDHGAKQLDMYSVWSMEHGVLLGRENPEKDSTLEHFRTFSLSDFIFLHSKCHDDVGLFLLEGGWVSTIHPSGFRETHDGFLQSAQMG